MDLMRAAKTGLYLLNLGIAGFIAHSFYAPKNSDADRAPTAQYNHAAPSTYRIIAATPQSPAVDPRVQALSLEGMTEYNSWLPAIIVEAEKTGVPARSIALCALVETDGHAQSRYRSQEVRFKKAHIDPIMDGKTDKKELKRTLEHMLAQQRCDRAIASEEEFREHLATSYGPLQILYINAIQHGYRGTAADLAIPHNSIHYGALHIKARENQHHYNDEKMTHAYNCGSLWKWVKKDGQKVKVATVPSQNHIARTLFWANKLRR